MIDTKQQGLHVAIIMDGNGRWATRRGLPRVAGHRAGAALVRRIAEHARDAGIRTLTLYAFSTDNWNRPAHEVRSLLSLLGLYLRVEREPLMRQGVRLEAIGRRDRLPRLLLREIEATEAATRAGRRLHLRVAIDYSARDAIMQAACATIASACGVRSAAEKMQQRVMAMLTAQCGAVDLLIRTGGEKRLSDFLLWESAYAELIFLDCMWPEFTTDDLDTALAEFWRRSRRFGGTGEVAERLKVSAGSG